MAAVARYLADTSALSRLDRPAVDRALSPLIEAGLVATCAMVELEVLYSARSPQDYLRRQRQLRDGFEQLAMPDEVWRRALAVQAALAVRSAHRGAALPDLLIAATAERHGVTVLHYDHEYDLIASVTTRRCVGWLRAVARTRRSPGLAGPPRRRGMDVLHAGPAAGPHTRRATRRRQRSLFVTDAAHRPTASPNESGSASNVIATSERAIASFASRDRFACLGHH